MNYKVMQQEQQMWLASEFPGQPVRLPLLGILEECGEAARCILKQEQALMHGEHPRYKGRDWHAELRDAIADMVIYACSAACTSDLDFAALFEEARARSGSHVRTMLSAIADVADAIGAALNRVDRPEYNTIHLISDLQFIMSAVCRFSSACQVDIDSAVAAGWAQVVQRRREDG